MANKGKPPWEEGEEEDEEEKGGKNPELNAQASLIILSSCDTRMGVRGNERREVV